MSKEVYGMKDNSPRWILWKFGLTTITKVHCQGNKQNLSHIRYARKHPPPPPSLISWWKNGKTEGWWDKYLPNPTRNKTVREREGKMVYKKRGRCNKKGDSAKFKRKDFEKNKRESYTSRIGLRVFSFQSHPL